MCYVKRIRIRNSYEKKNCTILYILQPAVVRHYYGFSDETLYATQDDIEKLLLFYF